KRRASLVSRRSQAPGMPGPGRTTGMDEKSDMSLRTYSESPPAKTRNSWPASARARAQARARLGWPRPRPWTTRLTRAMSVAADEGARGDDAVADRPAEEAADLPAEHVVAHVGRVDRHPRGDEAARRPGE